MDSSLVAKSQLCITAAKKAYDLIYTQKDAKEAVQHLSSLQDVGRSLQKVAEENKEDLLSKEDKLQKDMSRLNTEKEQHELSVARLNDDKYRVETKLKTEERLLSEAENELRKAEERLDAAKSELRRAKEKEKVVGVASVAGGIALGLVTFGIGGLVAGSAVGAGVATLINNLEGKARNARHELSRRGDDLKNAKREVGETRDKLSNIQQELSYYKGKISDYERKVGAVHDEITVIRKTIAFQKESLHIWDLFTQATESATERTERLKKLVSKAAEKKNFQILRRDGSITIAESFVDAWVATIDNGRIM